MSIEEDKLIQDFLRDNLSLEDKNKVLLKIEKDTDFRDKVNFEKQLFLNLKDTEWNFSLNTNHPEIKEYEALLRDEATQKLKNTLKQVNEEYQLKQKKSNIPSWLLYSGIAVVLVIIGLTIFSPFKASTDTLYADYLDLSELPSLVDRGSSEQHSLTEAQKLFEAKKYEQALTILEKEFSTVQRNKATIYLYTGISQMELGQFDKAENSFNTLIESNLIDSSKGKWYKALLYIKQNNLEAASKLLTEISQSSDNYKSKEATALLKQL